MELDAICCSPPFVLSDVDTGQNRTTMSTIMHWNMTLILDVFAKSAISCKKSICYLIVGSTNE
jgi:hypothetical protein